MGLSRGSFSGRRFESLVPIGADMLAAMFDESATCDNKPPVPAKAPIRYWTQVSREGGLVYGVLRVARRKPNAAQVRTEVRKELDAHMRRTGLPAGKAERKEIKAEVVDRLTLAAPIAFSDTEFLLKLDGTTVFATAASDAASDRLRDAWTTTTRRALVALGIYETLALIAPDWKQRALSERRLFGKDPDAGGFDDFLPWLLCDDGTCSEVAAVPPYIFVDGDTEGRVTIAGTPQHPPELRQAVRAHRELVSAGLTLAEWSCRVSRDLQVSSLGLGKECKTLSETLSTRWVRLVQFYEQLHALLAKYAETRSSAGWDGFCRAYEPQLRGE